MINDAGRGYRRVVPSPKPLGFPEMDAIRALLDAGYHVVTVGGGGIPVIQCDHGLEGVDAVVDKDSASSLLAVELAADLFVISTAVREVKLNFGTPEEEPIGTITATQAKRFAAEGNFAAGSMLPKIEAALGYLRRGGRRVVITDPAHVADAVARGTGTHIIP